MQLILMGAPGAGKGTQAAFITNKFGIPSISTGDILRGAVKAGTELGLRAKSFMDSGALVPDEIIINLIKDYIASDACKNGFILDGFPRSIPQAQALADLGVKIDCCLSIEVPDEAIVARMSGRRICSGCGASYHVVTLRPKVENVCDKCGASLYVRDDDAPETVLKRLGTYHAQTEPLKEFYGKLGLLKTVDGHRPVEVVSEEINRLLAEC